MNNGPANPPIFLYEDDEGLAQEIVWAFAEQGYSVTILRTRNEVLRAAAVTRPPVLILDRLVGNSDSIAIVEHLRREGNSTPVVVISSLVSVDDRIAGLKAGGDDYLVKPFAMGELIARVESLLRRTTDNRVTVLSVGSLTMDVVKRTVRRGGRAVALAPREFTLLEYLMRRPDQVITRLMILEDAWDFKGSVATNVVDVHMGTLRRKVDAEGEVPLIRNVRGVGFALRPDRP
ncbi:response regulator transcription factor [Beijerinckia sp. L45]|uniref:response regulator transcription factor n=1 Tax=Beijerinckia sp. L45 TaxID=1641855 RepID=UPI001FED792F|nr:response regulator transcription factor [Beijerinckia sp. L45]